MWTLEKPKRTARENLILASVKAGYHYRAGNNWDCTETYAIIRKAREMLLSLGYENEALDMIQNTNYNHGVEDAKADCLRSV